MLNPFRIYEWKEGSWLTMISLIFPTWKSDHSRGDRKGKHLENDRCFSWTNPFWGVEHREQVFLLILFSFLHEKNKYGKRILAQLCINKIVVYQKKNIQWVLIVVLASYYAHSIGSSIMRNHTLWKATNMPKLLQLQLHKKEENQEQR